MKIECKKVKNKICRFALDKVRKILIITLLSKYRTK